MKITVITVTYNCVSTIRRTIESVISQKDIDIEYIIIDGKSTDGTVDIIDEYVSDIDYFVSEKDGGIYHAMNKGIKASRGDFLFFLNGDDYFYDDLSLSRAKNYLKRHSITIGKIVYGNQESEIGFTEGKSKFFEVVYPHQATFISSDLFDLLGLYDEKYPLAADYEWICRALYNKCKLIWMNERVSYYSTTGRSTSIQFIIDQFLISKKYMLLDNDTKIADMTNSIIERTKTKTFENIIRNCNYIPVIKKKLLQRINNCNQQLYIWGAGFWAEPFVEMLERCGVTLCGIIDKNFKGKIHNIDIQSYDENIKGFFIVSTEKFDEEICSFLNKVGISSPKNLLSFHELRNMILEEEFEEKKMCFNLFEKKTGIKLDI